MKYGIWGGKKPCLWCRIWEPGDPDAGSYSSVDKEKVERVVKNFRSEYPDWDYACVEFDPEREPEAVSGEVSAEQLRVLRIIEKGQDPYNPSRRWERARQSTMVVLYERGLVRSTLEDRPVTVLTKAGREILVRYRVIG